MGLDIVSDDDAETLFSGGYMGWGMFRVFIAKELGLDWQHYKTMFTHGGFDVNAFIKEKKGNCDLKNLHNAMEEAKRKSEPNTILNAMRKKSNWKEIYFDILFHSDVDGEWTAQECKDLYLVLLPLASPELKQKQPKGHRKTLKTLIRGLWHCMQHQIGAKFE